MQFRRYEDNVDEDMFKSMVYYRGDTRVRWPALRGCGGHTHGHGCSCPLRLFSESGSMQRLCTRQLGLCTNCKLAQNPQMQCRRAHHKHFVWWTIWAVHPCYVTNLTMPSAVEHLFDTQAKIVAPKLVDVGTGACCGSSPLGVGHELACRLIQ